MRITNVKRFILTLLLGMMFLGFSSGLSAQNLEIHYINCLQGQSVLVKGPDGTTILIDGGYELNGTAYVVPYLRSIGILPTSRSLDYIVNTHRDTDHYAGLTEVLNGGYDALHIYDNGSTKTNTYWTAFTTAASTKTAGGVTPIALGQVINLGSGATATCVAVNGSVIGVGAIPNGQVNENDRSVVLLVKYGNFEYICTGDLGGGSDDNACTGRSTSQINIETSLVNAIMPGGAHPLLSSYGVEVAHVGHHASESSGNSDYMNKLSPQVACISVGAGQSPDWYHPRQDVVNVFLARPSCITAAPALVLQTEEGSPTGTLTSYDGYCVGDFVFTTDGVSSYTVTATGHVSQGPDERAAAGLPRTFYFEEGGSTPTLPVISNVHSESVTSTSANIVWTTDKSSNSVVKYGTTSGSYTLTASSATMVTAHTVSLTGLTAGQTYYYVVESTDSTGGKSTSSQYSLTTVANLPPVISNVRVSSITTTTASVLWTTDKSSNSVVKYGTTSGSYTLTASSSTMVTSHTVNISGLTAAKTYYYIVESTDSSGNKATSSQYSFTTSSSTGTVVFSQVYYDTIGDDTVEEWIELHNQTSAAKSIAGWKIVDNNGSGVTYTIPSGKTIPANGYITIAVNQTGFRAIYGFDANIYGTIPPLNNDGDALLLKDSSNKVIDQVAWEGGASSGIPTGWGSTTLPTTPNGSALLRTNPNTDTNKYTDWSVVSNNGSPRIN